MAKLFLSYSSTDKDFVRTLAADLRELGHQPWLDEWEIRVGDSIPSKIEQGISDADYVVIILTERALRSNWVEREWKSKYWQEVQTQQISVLPVLLEDCELPALLASKRYADFRSNYSLGLGALAQALEGKSELLREVPAHSQPPRLLAVVSILHDALEELEERPEAMTTGISTGLPELDRLTLGLQSQSLTVVFGSTGSGKTSLLLDIAANASLEEQRQVALFSLGSSQREIAFRLLCAEAHVSFRRFRSGHLSQKQWSRIITATRRMGECPLHITDSKLLNVRNLYKELTTQLKNDLGLIVIDDVGKIGTDSGYSILAELPRIFSDLKDLANRLKIPILVSASGEGVESPASVGAVEERRSRMLRFCPDADTVCLLEVTGDEDDEHTSPRTLEVVRNRFGPTATVELLFDHVTLTFLRRRQPPSLRGSTRGSAGGEDLESPPDGRGADRELDTPEIMEWMLANQEALVHPWWLERVATDQYPGRIVEVAGSMLINSLDIQEERIIETGDRLCLVDVGLELPIRVEVPLELLQFDDSLQEAFLKESGIEGQNYFERPVDIKMKIYVLLDSVSSAVKSGRAIWMAGAYGEAS